MCKCGSGIEEEKGHTLSCWIISAKESCLLCVMPKKTLLGQWNPGRDPSWRGCSGATSLQRAAEQTVVSILSVITQNGEKVDADRYCP
jgi:hypothetical protein